MNVIRWNIDMLGKNNRGYFIRLIYIKFCHLFLSNDRLVSNPMLRSIAIAVNQSYQGMDSLLAILKVVTYIFFPIGTNNIATCVTSTSS